ncbi:hypothetical protein [Emcibacter sp.]|uniref:hypothetical protein n=1 Tax=Emcibacter sp. TaxID=1979954 RepID=UPI003A92F505
MIASSYKELNRSIEWHILPVNRCISMVSEGRLDADIGRHTIVTEIYPNLVSVPVPLYTMEIDLISRKRLNTPLPAAEKFLIDDDRRVAYPEFILYIRNMLSPERSIAAKSAEQMVSLLKKGRVDFILLPSIETRRLQETDKSFSELHIVRQGYVKFQGYHILHQRHERLAVQLEETFRRNIGNLQD